MKDEVYLKKLGEKIVLIRKEKEIGQLDLAKEIGSSNTQLRRIERGEVNSTINMLRHIAKVLGVGVDELVKI